MASFSIPSSLPQSMSNWDELAGKYSQSSPLSLDPVNPNADEMPGTRVGMIDLPADDLFSCLFSFSAPALELVPPYVNPGDITTTAPSLPSGSINCDSLIFTSPPNPPPSSPSSANKEPFKISKRRNSQKCSNSASPSSSASTASSKRAEALAKNRQAANRYRVRQKEYVKNLEQRCRTELEKQRVQAAMIIRLRSEVSNLKDELLRVGLCGCLFGHERDLTADCLRQVSAGELAGAKWVREQVAGERKRWQWRAEGGL